MKYYVIRCPHCTRYIFMKHIKSDYKTCGGCGKRIPWRKMKKREMPSMESARGAAIYLNQQSYQIKDTVSIGELKKRLGKKE